MIISDKKYEDLQLKTLILQNALNANVIDINSIKDIVDIILNLHDDQTDAPAPQTILSPKQQLNAIFGKKMFNNQPEKTEQELKPCNILDLFANYLQDTYSKDKPFVHKWDPENRLSENQLNEIFNISKNYNFELSFEEATEVFFVSNHEHFDYLPFDIELIVNNFYKKYEKEYPNLKNIVDENKIDFVDPFMKNLNYNRNAKGLLDQTYLARLDIVLYDSHKGGCFKEDCINWLLKTQGYTKEYLYSKDELNKSTFLSSFYDALSEADANFIKKGNPYELVILAYTDCFDHAIALGDKKNIIINKSATLFFRDKLEGTFGPTIHLESNIIVDENMPIADIRFNCNIMPFSRETFDLKIVNTD